MKRAKEALNTITDNSRHSIKSNLVRRLLPSQPPAENNPVITSYMNSIYDGIKQPYHPMQSYDYYTFSMMPNDSKSIDPFSGEVHYPDETGMGIPLKQGTHPTSFFRFLPWDSQDSTIDYETLQKDMIQSDREIYKKSQE